MNTVSESLKKDTELIEKIHPMNANFLIEHLPTRRYADNDGNVLTLVVHPLEQKDIDALHVRGCIVGMLRRDGDGENFVHTCIVTSQGEIFRINSDGGVMKTQLKLDILYMLLNPLPRFHNWVLQDSEGAIQVMHDIGIKPEQNQELQDSINKARTRFATIDLGRK